MVENFIIDGQYQKLLTKYGININQVLKLAELPADTFAHHQIRLGERQYFDLLDAIEQVAADPAIAIKLATSNNIESFSAPLLAAFCSENGLAAIHRLAQYKKLIGPLKYQLTTTKDKVGIALLTVSGLPLTSRFCVESEFAFLVNFLSQGCGQRIAPIMVGTTFAPHQVVKDYLGGRFNRGPINRLSFKYSDLVRPFKTNNQSLLAYFEPAIEKRLSELGADDTYTTRVRSVLLNLLPKGQASAVVVAQALGLSKRTLQRKLNREQTSFQQQLNTVRAALAKNYLTNTALTIDEIAFLLAYTETNSFVRAFRFWTGRTPNSYREQV
ncbi:helix-turn-helix domain-containing protein [Limosilactobacillus sp.]|jgi:AraC-like DNA-binding protein|uniref:helix-turn-helix domain-containing protein n=1 Tax=Limosilactobacillus sp. TaxID=2773925 RepID=UPI00359F342B